MISLYYRLNVIHQVEAVHLVAAAAAIAVTVAVTVAVMTTVNTHKQNVNCTGNVVLPTILKNYSRHIFITNR